MHFPLCIITPPFRKKSHGSKLSLHLFHLLCTHIALQLLNTHFLISLSVSSCASASANASDFFFPDTHSLHSRDTSPLGFGIFQRLITNSGKKHNNPKTKCIKTFPVMVIKTNVHINTESYGGKLTVTLRRLGPVHSLSLAPAPCRLQSCSSSEARWASGLLKGQGFFSLHVHPQTPRNTLIRL